MRMEVHEIEVIIDPNGEVKIQVKDMKGDSCLIATKDLERLLGGEIIERKRTGGDIDDPAIPISEPKRHRVGE